MSNVLTNKAIILSQRDLRWSEDPIGISKVTVGQKGCTLTCLSMISSWFNSFLTPRQIADQKTWFNSQGQMLWGNLSFGNFKWDWRQYGYMPARIIESIKDPKKAVILELDGGAHWVEGAKVLPGGLFWVIDPWDGKGKINFRKITGSSHFIQK